MARQVLPVVGAVIGAYFGGSTGAQLGWTIGSLVGNAVDPLVIQRQGPRLDDLKVTTSAYGNPIPFIKGHPRIGGTIVWNSDRREIATTTEEDGKGGPVTETTTYTYEIDLLVELSVNQLAALRRIWSNGKMVWTRAPGADFQTYFAGDLFARRVTFYSGSDDQLPDPTYEAAVGVGNAPAYRGRSTVFIEGLQLGGGGNLPNLTFEVCENATISLTAPLVGHPDIHDSRHAGPIAVDEGGISQAVRYGYPSEVDSADRRLNWDGSTEDVQYFEVQDGGHPFTTPSTSDAPVGLEFLGGGSMMFYRRHEGGFPINLPETPGAACYAYNQRRLFLAANGASGEVYSIVDGGTTATSADLGDDVLYISAAQARVYCLLADGAQTLVVLDAASMATVSTISTPMFAEGTTTNAAVVLANEQGDVFLLANTPTVPTGRIWRLSGATWELIGTGLGDAMPASQASSVPDRFAISGQNIFRSYVDDVAGEAYVYALFQAVSPVDEPLTGVVNDLCERAGLDASQIDVTSIAGKTVRSLAVASVTSVRQVLDVLARGHHFQQVETGGKIKFVARGGAPAATVVYDDLGAAEDGAQTNGDPLPLLRANDDELPATVTVRYANVDNDYQEGAETSFRLTTGNGDHLMEVALGLTPTEAKRIADVTVTDVGIGLNGLGPVRLDRSASQFEPTDVLLLTDRDGSVYRARVEKIDDASGVRTLQLVMDDATVINSSASTSGDYQSSSTIALASSTRMELMDIPILRDADNDPGFYIALKGNGSNWPGGAYYQSADDTDYQRLGTVTERAVIGAATTVLGNWTGGNVFDETNQLTVDVGAGQLASSTRDILLGDPGVNALLVGSEVIQFRSAALVSAGVYTLSGLRRGLRGTEWAMATHEADERVVLLRTSGLRRVEMPLSELNLSRYYKAVTFGRKLGSVFPTTFVNTGVGLKPFSPTDLRASRGASGAIVLSWHRRSRLSMPVVGTVVPPLGEATEAYEIEIYNGVALLRTLGATSSSVTYSLQDVIADFGVVPTTLSVRVYQMSEQVGRGYVLQATVDVPPAASGGGAFLGGTQLDLAAPLVVNGHVLAWARGYFPEDTAPSTRIFESDDGETYTSVDLDGPVITRAQRAVAVKGTTWVSFPYEARNGNPASWDVVRGIQGSAPVSLGSLFLPTAWAVTVSADASKFVAITEGNSVYTSSDGSTWALAGTMSGSLPAVLTNGSNGIGANTGAVQLFYLGGRWHLAWSDKILYSTNANALSGWTVSLDLAQAPHSFTAGVILGMTEVESTLVALVRGNTGSGTQLSVLTSTDNGVTWSVAYSVNDSSPPAGVNLAYVYGIAPLGVDVVVFCTGTFARTLKGTVGLTAWAWGDNNLTNTDGMVVSLDGATLIVRDASRNRGDGVLEYELKQSTDGLTFTACTGI
jgi:hypothetical protein